MNSLSAHLDGWLELVEDYGRTLVAYCPEQLRTMLIEILPDGLEDELDHPMNAHIVTHMQIVEWCKARTTKSRNKALAAQKLKQVVPGKLNPLVTPSGSTEPVPEQPPAWAKPIINMVQQYDRGRKPKSDQGARRSSPSPSQRARTPSPSGFKPKGRFVFRGGCNHCGKKGHERRECREFIALKEKNGGKPPEGYKGAR